MQNAALAELGLGRSGPTRRSRPAGALRGARSRTFPARARRRQRDIPHKLAALRVAERRRTPPGRRCREHAQLRGARSAADNTDALGTARRRPRSPARAALVLGAGGSARAVSGASRAGARSGIRDRTASRAEALVEELGGRAANERRERVDPSPYDLVLNGATSRVSSSPPTCQPTSADLEAGKLSIAADSLSERQVIMERVYGSHETALASRARERGSRVIDGLGVLVRQGSGLPSDLDRA